MLKIPRFIKNNLVKHLQPGKVVVLYGPRQVGKTTLIKDILQNIKDDYLFISGEDINVSMWLSSQSISTLKKHIGNKKLLVIDEAQKINKIGLNLKLIVDHIENIKIIATGSSSFELANQIGEPLVGRKWTYILYPIAQLELTRLMREDFSETKSALNDRLIYGSYPEIISTTGLSEKRELLYELINSYLYKDVFSFKGIKKSEKIHLLLKKIAFQIGHEVSMQELGMSLGIDSRTVEKYLDLLEKSFIIKRVFGYSGNLRKEITKTSRFYFLDNGVRNAVIDNLNSLENRNDIGQLWENYLFIERMKKREYDKIYANQYFWRTYDKKEIDLVEERDGKLFGYEFKWNSRKKIKPPRDWFKAYPNAEFKIITPDNYLDFIV